MLRFALRALLMLLAVQLSGCALFYKYEAISDKPPRDGSDVPLTSRASTLQPHLTAPLGLLTNSANAAAAKVIPIQPEPHGTSRAVSLEIMKPWWLGGGCFICEYVDVIWHFQASQPSPITITGGSDRLALTVPAAITGGAGFNGEIAKWLSLRDKSFDAAAAVTFSTGFAADRNYCPTLTNPELSYAWIRNPTVELVGENCVFGYCFNAWRLDLSRIADKAIGSKLSDIAGSLQQNIPCTPIREGLAKVWHGYSFPIKVPYEQLNLNIAPRALYLPGLGVTNTDLVFTGRLDADVSLDPVPISIDPLPLPSNDPLPISSGRFSLSVPISTQYYTFNALAKQELDKQKLVTHTSLGNLRITPTQVELYPTADGQALALGVSVAVEFQYLFFLNSSGTVWFTATPEAVDSGRRIRLRDIKVTRKFSNPIWDVASVILEDKIADALSKGFELDLNDPLSKVEADITSKVNNVSQGGVSLSAHDVKISVGRMLANEKAFQLEAIFDAQVDASLGKIPLP